MDSLLALLFDAIRANLPVVTASVLGLFGILGTLAVVHLIRLLRQSGVQIDATMEERLLKLADLAVLYAEEAARQRAKASLPAPGELKLQTATGYLNEEAQKVGLTPWLRKMDAKKLVEARLAFLRSNQEVEDIKKLLGSVAEPEAAPAPAPAPVLPWRPEAAELELPVATPTTAPLTAEEPPAPAKGAETETGKKDPAKEPTAKKEADKAPTKKAEATKKAPASKKAPAAKAPKAKP